MSIAEHNFRTNRNNSNIRECFCKDESCSETIINAHSLSQSSTLKLIKGLTTSGEGVILLNEIRLEKGEVINKPVPQGWKKHASIFNGFCKDHDREVFKPIEAGNPFDNTDEQCFLHSMRSFAYTYHKNKESEKFGISTLDYVLDEADNLIKEVDKQNELLSNHLDDPNAHLAEMLELVKTKNLNFGSLKKMVLGLPGSENYSDEQINDQVNYLLDSDIIKNLLSSNVDKESLDSELIKNDGVDFIKEKVQSAKDEYLERKGANQTLTQVAFEPIKKKLLGYLAEKRFDKLQYLVRIERKIFPFATAGCFFPQIIDESGSSLVIANDDNKLIFPVITVTIVPDKFNRTMIILSCLKDDLNSCFYLKKLGSLRDNVQFQKAITGIILNSCSDNTFLNPDFWNKLCLNDEDKLIAREVTKKRPLDKLDQKPYLASINLFADRNAFIPPTSHP